MPVNDKLDLLISMQTEQTTMLKVVSDKVVTMESDLKTINGNVKKHETVLYGIPGDLNNIGIVAITAESAKAVRGLGKRIDDLKGKVWLTLTGAFALIQVLIRGLLEVIKK